MVLEALFPTKSVVRNPIDMFALASIITFASFFLANIIFPGIAEGKIITLFITAALAPIICGIFSEEEEVERECAEHKIKKQFLDRHDEAIKIFTLLFIGVFAAYFLVSIIFPIDFVKVTFDDQITEVERIMNIPTGNAVADALSPGALEIILWNNLKVMGLSFALSFLIGVGAVVILAWNASILAIYLASFIREGIIEHYMVGVDNFMIRTVSIIPHAPIEIFGFFMAGIAGGILSVGIIREKVKSREFLLVFRDSMLLLFIAVAAIFLAAFVEVFV